MIERIHQSAKQLVLSITGGGSGAIAALLEVPGGSATVLEARVPYAQAALEEWLGGPVDQACSEPTARAMAMAAFVRVHTPGDAPFTAGQVVHGTHFARETVTILAQGGVPPIGEATVLGVSEAALNGPSVLAAAGFERSAQGLTWAAIDGVVDRLTGAPERVMVGRRIATPAEAATPAELATPAEPAWTITMPLNSSDG